MTQDDPRLPELSEDWELIRSSVTGNTRDDRSFKNKRTGEVIDHDPRLTPKVLTECGVKLETFRIC